MSAIEILKVRQRRLEQNPLIPASFNYQEHKALSEAIVALEKQGKLVEWLEKGIEKADKQKGKEPFKGQELIYATMSQTLKEVLGKLQAVEK